MSFIDIIFAALLIWGLIKGLKNGLFIELASLVSLFVGIYAAVKFSYFAKSMIEPHLSWSPETVQLTAFILTLLVVVIIIFLSAKILTGLVDFAFLGWLNTLGGGLFAVLKTILLIGTVCMLIEKINFNKMLVSDETKNESIFFHPVQKVSSILMPFVTESFNTAFEDSLD